VPRKPCFDIRDLRAKVIQDIRDERAAKVINREERKNSDSYISFIASHMAFAKVGGTVALFTEQPYALAVQIRCPWSRCSTLYRVARFVSLKEGKAFHLVCTKCRQRVITLRDSVRIYGTNTYPVREIQEQIAASPSYETHCREAMAKFLERQAIWLVHQKARARGKMTELLPETSHHRAIKMRTIIEKDDDTISHLNQGFRKRKLKKVWGLKK